MKKFTSLFLTGVILSGCSTEEIPPVTIEIVVHEFSMCAEVLTLLEAGAQFWRDEAGMEIALTCIVSNYPGHVHANPDPLLSLAEAAPGLAASTDGLVARFYALDSASGGEFSHLDGFMLRNGCMSVGGMIKPDPDLLAHEFGHWLGLSHEDSLSNVMHESGGVDVGTAVATDEQLEGISGYVTARISCG